MSLFIAASARSSEAKAESYAPCAVCTVGLVTAWCRRAETQTFSTSARLAANSSERSDNNAAGGMARQGALRTTWALWAWVRKIAAEEGRKPMGV